MNCSSCTSGPLASQPSLARQKDVLVARCLCGLRYSDTVALLRPHIEAGGQVNHISLDQQKTRGRADSHGGDAAANPR